MVAHPLSQYLIMLVAVYGRPGLQDQASEVQQLLEALLRADARVLLYAQLFDLLAANSGLQEELGTFHKSDELPEQLDFFLTIGGDGTLLDALTWVGDREVPVLGINFGRLGFLTSAVPSKVKEAVDNLLHGRYVIEKRSMIRLSSEPGLFGHVPYGLNEFALHKKDISSMIRVKTLINGEVLNTYYADGLIVSTPTGSTGYSISCGGPIILPDADTFVITPVAPHNLNVRPVVVRDNAIVSFEIEGKGNLLASLDSRMETIDATYKLSVSRNPFCFPLVRLNDYTHLRSLRNKLLWGIDKRNS